MRKEIRQKIVDYKVYIADDGEEFSSKKKCIIHERLVSGEIKVCPCCHGEGRTPMRMLSPDIAANWLTRPTVAGADDHTMQMS